MGTIIVGYQGVGKSTLARGGNGFIDLESSNFWVDGKRSDDWYKVYANIAVHLAQQGYNVFTSSHLFVRQVLEEVCPVHIVQAYLYPVLSLRDEWIQKLKARYEDTKKDKDYKAWKNAEGMYDINILELKNTTGVVHIVIKDMQYDLKKLLRSYSIIESGVGIIEPPNS